MEDLEFEVIHVLVAVSLPFEALDGSVDTLGKSRGNGEAEVGQLASRKIKSIDPGQGNFGKSTTV